MERLTSHDPNMGLMINEEERLLSSKGFVGDDERSVIMRNLAEKLAEYEDLEENGKLKKLPCRVGDTIFVIPSETNYRLNILNGYKENNRIYEQVVDHIVISRYGYLLITCNGMQSVIEQSYKKTWFLIKSEAEGVLEEMESKYGK